MTNEFPTVGPMASVQTSVTRSGFVFDASRKNWVFDLPDAPNTVVWLTKRRLVPFTSVARFGRPQPWTCDGRCASAAAPSLPPARSVAVLRRSAFTSAGLGAVP